MDLQILDWLKFKLLLDICVSVLLLLLSLLLLLLLLLKSSLIKYE